MASDCDPNCQKNRPGGEPSHEGISTMETVSQGTYASTKVLAKACDVVDKRQAAAAAPSGRPKARAIGRFEKSVDELAQAVEKYREEGER